MQFRDSYDHKFIYTNYAHRSYVFYSTQGIKISNHLDMEIGRGHGFLQRFYLRIQALLVYVLPQIGQDSNQRCKLEMETPIAINLQNWLVYFKAGSLYLQNCRLFCTPL